MLLCSLSWALLQPLNNCMDNACASMVHHIAQFSTQDGMNVRYQKILGEMALGQHVKKCGCIFSGLHNSVSQYVSFREAAV